MKKVLFLGLMMVFGGPPAPSPAQTPVARIYHSMMETDDGRIIMLAGVSKRGWAMDLHDTWAYDFESNRWNELGEFEAGEFFGAYSSAYDRQSGRIILFNREGQTWALDPSSGAVERRNPEEAPSPRCGQGMVYDSGSDRVVLFGGFLCTSVSDPVYGDTWSYDYESDSWTEHSPAVAPSPRMYPGMVYHAGADRVITWGGRVEDSEVWAFDLEAEEWAPVPTTGGPEGIRSYHTLAYDPGTEGIIAFGGMHLDTWIGLGGAMLNETWFFDLASGNWTLLETTNTPPARSTHAMAVHGPTGSLVIFGGELETPYSGILSDEVWAFDPATLRWSRRVP